MAKEELNLVFNVEDNLEDVIDRMTNISDHVDKFDNEFEKFAKKGLKDTMDSFSDMEEFVMNIGDTVNKIQKNYKFDDAINKSVSKAENLQDAFSKMGDIQNDIQELTLQRVEATTEAEKKGIDEIIKKKKEKMKATKELFDKEAKFVTKALKEEEKEMKELFGNLEEQSKKSFEKMGEEGGEKLKSGFGALIQGDAGGFLGGLEGLGGAADTGLGGLGQRMQAAGAKKGHALKAGGKGKMGAAIGGLSKAAGALTAAAGAIGAVGALVALFMKANAQTQELNKTFLETTPMIKMAADGLGTAEENMSELRDAATDFQTNVRLGLSPQEHMEMIAQLQEHNIMISELAEKYGGFGAAASEAVETIRIAQLNLGASSDEVTQFVGQMMDIQSRSFGEVQTALTSIVDEAEEAGISSKKFFSTISQLTGQMGLYNFKLESSVTLLSELNKVMDAENAAQFTEELTHGLKNANAQERMRLMVLNSEAEVSEMVRENAEAMLDSFENSGALGRWLKEMGKSTENMGETLGNLSTEEEIDLIAKAQRQLGEEGSRRLERMIAQFEAAEEGGFKLVDAMQDLGAIQNLELQVTAAEKVFGKPIQELSDMQADAMGIDANQLRAMKRFSTISKGNLRTLQAMAKKEDMTQERFQQMAEQMGINAKINEKGQVVNEKTGEIIKDQYDVMKATKDERKDEIKDQAEAQKSAAEMQVEKTQNVADILQYMIADLLNELGVVTSEINAFLHKHLGDATGKEIALSDLRSNRKKMEAQVRAIQKDAKDRDLTEEEKERIKSLRKSIKLNEERVKMIRGMKGDQSAGSYVAKAKQIQTEAGQVGALGHLSPEEYRNIKVDPGKVSAMARQRAYKKHGVELGPDGKPIKIGKGAIKTKGGSIGAQYLETLVGSERAGAIQDLKKKKVAGKIIDKKSLEIQNEAMEKIGEETVNQKQATKRVEDVLKDKGIQVHQQAAEKIAKSIVAEQTREKLAGELAGAGFKKENARTLASLVHGGASTENVIETAKNLGIKPTDKMKAKIQELTSVPTAKDARMVTGGIPFLNLQKGDIIVDEESLASTVRGGKGAMVPDLMKKAGLDGGGGGYRQNVVINVNGGDTKKVQQVVLKTLDMVKRRNGGK